MNSLTHGITVYALLALVGMAAGALISALIFTLGRRWLLECPPAIRARLLLALLLCPVIAALALMLGMSAPGSFFSVGEISAHCGSQGGMHYSFCQWHAPQITLPQWLIYPMLLVVGLIVAVAGRAVLRMHRAQQRMRFIRHLARPQPAGHYLLPMQKPAAFAAGLLRGQAFVSEGLVQRLQPEQLEIVLAHEHAHVAHRDMLLTLVANALAKVQLPWVGKTLRNDWHLAVEQRCDEEVARQTGNRVAVADCLLHVARLQSASYFSPATPGACHLMDGDLPTRICALLREPGQTRLAPALSIGSLELMALAGVLLAGPHILHWMEILLPGGGM